jgi:hypothetical protein
MNRLKSTLALLAFATVVHAQAPINGQEFNQTPADTAEEISGLPPLSPDAIPLNPGASSVGEIQQQIGLPKTARLKEYEEDISNPKAAFSDDQLAKIFSDKPKFIYFPEGVDPMIIPWVRERVIAEEKAAEAMVAMTAKDYARAEQIWTELRERFPNTPQGQDAPKQLVQIEDTRKREAAAASTGDVITTPSRPNEVVTLPDWVRDNTTGVMIISGLRTVVVGNDFLKVGDQVPRYAGVTVKEIKDSEVIYEFQNQDFVTEVLGTF